MAMSAAAAALLVACVAAGKPECPPQRDDCLKRIGGNTDFAALERPAACKAVNWKEAERCFEHCPNQLVVTEPQEVAHAYCAEPDKFEPVVYSRMLSLDHPLNGVELDMVTLPKISISHTGRRQACQASDFDGVNVTGKIAVVERGMCKFALKGLLAQERGAVAVIVVSHHTDETYFDGQWVTPAGRSTNLTIPLAAISRMDGALIFEALDAGRRVRGKHTFSCAEPPPARPVEEWDGGCYRTQGMMNVGREGLCYNETDDEDRLCARCPLTLQYPADDPEAEQLCLFGNRLQPVLRKNTLWSIDAPPFNLTSGSVVFVKTGVQHLCKEVDFTAMAGKMVILPQPNPITNGDCLGHEVVRRAQRAGVTGVIFRTPNTTYSSTRDHGTQYMMTGTAAFIDIPVHAMSREAGVALEEALERGAALSPFGTMGWVLRSVGVAEGVMPPPVLQMDDDKQSNLFPIVAVSCVAVALCVLVAALWVKCRPVGEKYDASDAEAPPTSEPSPPSPLSPPASGRDSGEVTYSPEWVTLSRQLGQGATSVVMLGTHTATQAQLAVKHMKATAYMQAELGLLLKLRHPHIVALKGFHVDEMLSAAVLYLEYVPGGSLHDVVTTAGRMYELSVRRCVRDAAVGLHYLHAQGVVHRDVKPHNLLIDEHGRVKLADFGCCKDSVGDATVTTMATGTPQYMAPEVLEGKVSFASDIWSVGATVTHLASGELPYAETGLSGLALMSARARVFGGAGELHPEIPAHLSPAGQRLLKRCFAAPRDRPTCSELLEDAFLSDPREPLEGTEPLEDYRAAHPASLRQQDSALSTATGSSIPSAPASPESVIETVYTVCPAGAAATACDDPPEPESTRTARSSETTTAESA